MNERKTFLDYEKKKGALGSRVAEKEFLGNSIVGEIKTVKSIMSLGRKGTWLIFEEGGNRLRARDCLLVEDIATCQICNKNFEETEVNIIDYELDMCVKCEKQLNK